MAYFRYRQTANRTTRCAADGKAGNRIANCLHISIGQARQYFPLRSTWAFLAHGRAHLAVTKICIFITPDPQKAQQNLGAKTATTSR